MAVQNHNKTFEIVESIFFSLKSVLYSDITDPDKNLFNDKLQQNGSPYFSLENFITISEQLNKDNFSILDLNIRSLNANIDNFTEFLASLNGHFSVIVLTESWCDEAVNEYSSLNLDRYYSVHQTRNNKKGGGICIYIHKQLECKVRNDIDIFNNGIETSSAKMINLKFCQSVVTGVYRPPKGDIKTFKNLLQRCTKNEKCKQ